MAGGNAAGTTTGERGGAAADGRRAAGCEGGIRRGAGLRRAAAAAAAGAALALGALPAAALILDTTDPDEVADFADGADVESFDVGVTGTALESYAAGQSILEASRFSSRDGTRLPTFHSGGASPSDPVGNPGAPIGIVTPAGAIAADVVSGENVAAPLVIFSDEPWNNGFMEVIFPEDVERVGFWITHGSVSLDLRDRTGNTLASGDVSVTGAKGSFIGIARPSADIAVAALFAAGGGDAFTIDDFVSTAAPVPEAGAPLLLAAGGAVLAAARRRGTARR